MNVVTLGELHLWWRVEEEFVGSLHRTLSVGCKHGSPYQIPLRPQEPGPQLEIDIREGIVKAFRDALEQKLGPIAASRDCVHNGAVAELEVIPFESVRLVQCCICNRIGTKSKHTLPDRPPFWIYEWATSQPRGVFQIGNRVRITEDQFPARAGNLGSVSWVEGNTIRVVLDGVEATAVFVPVSALELIP
jgi:hypothetical protein